MSRPGSALRRILEQEHSDRERILIARENAEKHIAEAQATSAQLLARAKEEAQQLIETVKKRSVQECDSIRREQAFAQGRSMDQLATRFSEIEEALAADVARRLVGDDF